MALFGAGRAELKLHTSTKPHSLQRQRNGRAGKGCWKQPLKGVSAVALYDQPSHAPGEQKTETLGLREALHLRQLLNIAAL